MSQRSSSHLFWGAHSPLSALTGVGLIIMASSRFSFAVICAAALVWVYGLTALVFSGAQAIMPQRGKKLILLFLSTFFAGLFMIFASILNPLLLLSSLFFLFLIPPHCLGSGFFDAPRPLPIGEAFPRALLEAIALAGIILAFALIREPLGMGTLSVPGGIQGITELFHIGGEFAFVPIQLLTASAGGLLLLGYGIALFRYFRDRGGNAEQIAVAQNEAPEENQ
ncbi:MAG: hypothetical protein FWC65_03855 [Treponema sp.]|nr:hypothetical protein [Treponema sp.]